MIKDMLTDENIREIEDRFGEIRLTGVSTPEMFAPLNMKEGQTLLDEIKRYRTVLTQLQELIGCRYPFRRTLLPIINNALDEPTRESIW